jgi:hypothetical protein
MHAFHELCSGSSEISSPFQCENSLDSARTTQVTKEQLVDQKLNCTFDVPSTSPSLPAVAESPPSPVRSGSRRSPRSAHADDSVVSEGADWAREEHVSPLVGREALAREVGRDKTATPARGAPAPSRGALDYKSLESGGHGDAEEVLDGRADVMRGVERGAESRDSDRELSEKLQQERRLAGEETGERNSGCFERVAGGRKQFSSRC